MILECLEQIIGLSETTCDCFDPKPADYDKSNSGLFLDQLPGIDLQIAASPSPCEKGGVWDLMSLARKNAIKEFQTDLFACIASVSKAKRKNYRGTIGEPDWTMIETPGGNYVGWKLTSPNIKDAYIRIKSITTIMDSNATFDIQVYSNIDQELVHTFTGIQSEALKRKKNDVDDLVLPLFDEKCGEELIYYIVYQPTTFSPLDNDIDCGCGSKDRSYLQFFELDGTYGNDPSTKSGQENFVEFSKAQGLCIQADVFCRLDDAICQYTVDNHDPMFQVMAKAIQFKAGEFMAEYILQSGNINRYTLLSKERLWGKRNHYQTQYNTRIMALCGDVDLTNSDCFSCENQVMQMHTVRS